MLSRLFADTEARPYRALRGERALVVLVALLAETLRLLGIRLGLPFIHHWDEVLVTSSARGMLERGDDMPANYFYGAPIARLVVLAARVAHALHLPGSAGPPGEELHLRWVGRPVAATLAASGTLAVYLAGRMIFRRGDAALWGALLYAVGAELVWHARYLVTDASVVALTAWTLALAAAYAERRTLLLGLLATLSAGLAFSFKLTGLATVLIPVGVLAVLPPRGFVREGDSSRALVISHRALLAAAVPLVVLTFLWLNPHVQSDWRHAFSDWEGITKHYREGHVKPFCERDPGMRHVLAALWFLSGEALHTSVPVALLLAAVGVVGLALSVREGRLLVVLGIVHALGVVVAMAWPNRAFLVRMYLPALPILCIGFGRGAVALADELRSRANLGRSAPWLVAACALALSATSVVQSILCQMGSIDPRERAVDVVAREARTRGREVTLRMTSSVDGAASLGGNGSIRRLLARDGVRMLGDVDAPAAATTDDPDFVVVASFRDLKKIWPYEQQWPFQSLPGYREIARFRENPYEERLDLVPTWDGHVSAIVLERE